MQTNFLQPPYYSTTSPNQSRTSPASKYHLNLQLPSHLRPSARYLQAPAAKSTLVSPIQPGAVITAFTAAVVRAEHNDFFRTGHSKQAI